VSNFSLKQHRWERRGFDISDFKQTTTAMDARTPQNNKFNEQNKGCARTLKVFCTLLKARLHRRFLSRQLDAIFVAPKLHQVSNMFETPAISRRQIAVKIAPGLHVRF